ncbi:MICOS complex subunit Mic19-like [Anopheles cruzii]|uniref:MICOS complex subunit Mic19-like n=1 Tax=Anopheles cruzii TaxID=68878 RepID=UPI0022EC8D2E|nr:MICOS complex subunit Mic19-like [Anopheles cruzii]
MGAAPSNTRTVVIPNTSANVIDISDNVVKRMANGTPAKAKEDQQQQQPDKSATSDSLSTGTGPSSYPNPVTPKTVFHGEMPLTSMQIRQETERALQENDDLWAHRLKAMETNLTQMEHVLEKEYNEAVADVKKHFGASAMRQPLPPCQDMKAKVIECYRTNGHETLRCASVVQRFADCVNQHRIQLLQLRVATEEAIKKQ